jgi:predicted DNA-binding protein (MmcQ/YjbR family)
MELEDLKKYCAGKAGSKETYPFGPDTLVFKLAGKMYALAGTDQRPLRINLKCDPEQAQVLRAMHENIIPGYHMNKEHWNTVICDGSLPSGLIYKLIDDSYDLVRQKLSRSEKKRLINKS